MQQLLILTPFEFPNSSSDTFQKALLSNHLIPTTVSQLTYGNTQINPHADAAMGSAAQTIIFVDRDAAVIGDDRTAVQALL